MQMARRRNFHLPLSEEMHTLLREEARRAGKPATEVAREALETTLRERKREELRRAIAAYAAAVAGSTDDLDPDLEQAGLEHLAGSGRRRRR